MMQVTGLLWIDVAKEWAILLGLEHAKPRA